MGLFRKKGVEYNSFGTSKLAIFLKQSFPKEMIPSNRTGSFLGSIFIVVILLSFLNFPLNDFLKGNLDTAIDIGWPWHFLVISLLDPTASPLRVAEFIWSILLYLFVAYMIEVSINYFMSMDIFKSRREKNAHPRFFKDVHETLASKAARKLSKPSSTASQNTSSSNDVSKKLESVSVEKVSVSAKKEDVLTNKETVPKKDVQTTPVQEKSESKDEETSSSMGYDAEV